jgi:uncharacterized membrane protein
MTSDLSNIKELRKLKHKRKESKTQKIGLGDIVADRTTNIIGSWKFIIIQSTLLFIWILLNVTAYMNKWDPYPFILLNLMLSFQAAYTAPIIMMSQNRQGISDRMKAEDDYYINLKAELEIELLHDKIDTLSQQLQEVHEAVKQSNTTSN